MCGIVAYSGKKAACPILIEGLKRLEYRGYDSSGVSLLNGSLQTFKKKGKVKDLENILPKEELTATLGIGHTRWATHGEPNDVNAHPHLSGNGRLALVHNGIIENYASIKEALIKRGHTFSSETDTEVLVHYIEELQSEGKLALEEAVRQALLHVEGAYAIVVIDSQEPNKLVGAKKQSPLVVGIAEDSFYFASDATPIISHTNKVVYLKDGEIAVAELGKELVIRQLSNIEQKLDVQELSLDIQQIEKGGYEHYMLKEIDEQPKTIADGMRGRLNGKEGWTRLDGLEEYSNRISSVKRIIIAACGTSWHSGLIGEYLIEEFARIPVEVEYASELRYRNPIIGKDDLVIAISQSGETADTLAAVNLAKEKGALVYGLVNAVGSTIARASHCGSYLHAGPEIGVASTKAFTSQVTLLAIMALNLGMKRGTLSNTTYHRLISALEQIPSQLSKVLEQKEQIKYIAGEIKSATNALYLGRGFNFPVALEGALKLKEISYIHAEGYPAAEMKHGPIALIDIYMPVFVIATKGGSYDKIVSNIQEVKARKGKIIAIITEGDETIKDLADYYIEIPLTEEALTPLLSVVPLQLLSYYIAVMRGCNVDQPRNLAKSVTVE